MKNFGGIKTRYLLDGTNIIAQEVTNGDSLDYFYFFYDASGNILQMNDTTDGWFKVGTANPFRDRGYYYIGDAWVWNGIGTP